MCPGRATAGRRRTRLRMQCRRARAHKITTIQDVIDIPGYWPAPTRAQTSDRGFRSFTWWFSGHGCHPAVSRLVRWSRGRCTHIGQCGHLPPRAGRAMAPRVRADGDCPVAIRAAYSPVHGVKIDCVYPSLRQRGSMACPLSRAIAEYHPAANAFMAQHSVAKRRGATGSVSSSRM